MWTLFISLKYFFSRRKEGMISLIGFISVLGVAVGVASLIIVLSVMNGFDQEVREKIIGTYSHLIVMRENGIKDYSSLISQLKALPGIKNASPCITGQAILRKENAVSGILVKGILPEEEAKVTEVIKYTKQAGTKLDKGVVILGSELMKNEGISVGDNIELLVPHSMLDLEKTNLMVSGSFTSGRYDYDANMAIISLNTAMELFRTDGAVTSIGFSIKDELNANSKRDELQRLLEYPYIVKSWMDLDKNLVTALALEKKMMFIILALIVMVACFNISGSLIMMVMEKTKDIGILKAIGANSFGVSLVFLLQGAIIGFIGIGLGALSGVFIANRVDAVADLLEKLTGITVFPNDVYYFTDIPVKISPSDIMFVVCVAFVLALVAGVYPAWKASRLDPVEAIRYE